MTQDFTLSNARLVNGEPLGHETVKNESLLNEDMILALAGQFKQLSHEPEKFR